MLSKLQGIIDAIQDSKAAEVFDAVRRKQRLYNSEMQIGDNLLKIKESSHLVMDDPKMFIKEIKLELVDEYFQVTFDNGEIVHYNYFGEAYLSLKPTSNLYNFRLSRYDIKNII